MFAADGVGAAPSTIQLAVLLRYHAPWLRPSSVIGVGVTFKAQPIVTAGAAVSWRISSRGDYSAPCFASMALRSALYDFQVMPAGQPITGSDGSHRRASA